MTAYYADSSVLVKRHVAELGSGWVGATYSATPVGEVISSQLCVVEVLSALNRRVREGSLSMADYQVVRSDFLTLCQGSYSLVPIADSLLRQTQVLLERHPLAVSQHATVRSGRSAG
jgi:predicted nucleic acid-binding protein